MTDRSNQAITPVLLLILDGFGYREDADFNAVATARISAMTLAWVSWTPFGGPVVPDV